MIEVEHLSKFYSSRKAIENISFKIREGEIIGLLGLNGAGKSTILKILGCYLAPSGGHAKVGGYSIMEQPEEVRKLIGYLPDRVPLYDEMTVRGYLEYVARLKGVAAPQVEDGVNEAIRNTNLEQVADIRLDALSHGFRQRVGIAQAIVHRPKVLILDEPINGLDPIQIVEMRDLILSFKNKHTVILSSHILSEITKTCDRILVIDRGLLVAEGAEAQLQGSLAGSMRLEVEWSGDEKVVQAVRGVSGVRSLKTGTQNNHSLLVIETDADVRADVAKQVIQNGGQLYGLKRADEGLETLFMKLIQAE